MKKYSIIAVEAHYQPIIRLKDGKTTMYECLARFRRTDGVKIAPGHILHLFNDHDFLWSVFKQIFPQIVEHTQKNIQISVNLDVYTITDKFFYFIEEYFVRFPSMAQNVHFEVTEQNIIKGLGGLAEKILAIKKFGAKVVLDDFGTGGANIECLELVDFDYVKIDGRFIKSAEENKNGLKKLQLIVNLLKSYNTPIIGEHIETYKSEAIAHKLGIDYGQGFLYGYAEPILA